MSVDQLRPLVRQLARTAQEQAYAWMLTEEPTSADLMSDLPDMIRVYCESAALLAAEWYNDEDPDSGYFAQPHSEIADERLDATARWVFDGPQAPANRMRQAAHALVFDAARNTVYRNAEMEGVAVARHERAEACNDCAARASVVPVARSSRSDGIAAHFHPSCEGMLVPVRRGLWEPPEYMSQWRQRIALAKEAGNTSPDTIAKWLDAH